MALIISLFSCHRPFNTGTTVKINTVKVVAPFSMPAINIPDFNNCKKFLITNYGAVSGDKENTGRAIARNRTCKHKWWYCSCT